MTIWFGRDNKNESSVIGDNKANNSCKDCDRIKTGECMGKNEICAFFEFSLNLSKDEIMPSYLVGWIDEGISNELYKYSELPFNFQDLSENERSEIQKKHDEYWDEYWNRHYGADDKIDHKSSYSDF